jgi:excisionase family DNA binding protein
LPSDIAVIASISYLVGPEEALVVAMSGPSTKDTSIARVLQALVSAGRDVSVNVQDRQVKVPDAILPALIEAAKLVSEGHAIDVIPVDEEVSAQEAADILKVSHPYLLNLVNKGILPCRMVGAHHRIPMSAVIAYKRDEASRRRSLEALTAETQDLGH